jgi:hypothetical protein
LGGVASFPETWDTVDAEVDASAKWAAWEKATVAWLQGEYGDRLASIVRHEDEEHPHVHFYVLPDLGKDGRLRISDVHDGRRAAESAKAAGLAKGPQNDAYKASMRAYQSRYWESVGFDHGLTRLGPGRRRLTRAAWQAEQMAATAAANALRRAEQVTTTATGREARAMAVVEQARSMVASAKAQAAEARAAADAARRKAETDVRRKARAILARAHGEGRRLVADAESRAAAMRRLGGWIGSLWSGFRNVEKRLTASADAKVAAAKREAASEVVRAKDALRVKARQAVKDELALLRCAADRAERDRQNAETRAAKAEAEVRMKTDAIRQTKAALSGEKSARCAAEAEREKFRTLWADADNALIALRKPTSGPRPRGPS